VRWFEKKNMVFHLLLEGTSEASAVGAMQRAATQVCASLSPLRREQKAQSCDNACYIN
jgi:hypothetical protein